MQTITLNIVTETGLHSRPADLFVRTSKLYASTIAVKVGEKTADAKNILKLILLNISKGTSFTISADGADEAAALADLKQLVESDFQKVNEKVKI